MTKVIGDSIGKFCGTTWATGHASHHTHPYLAPRLPISPGSMYYLNTMPVLHIQPEDIHLKSIIHALNILFGMF